MLDAETAKFKARPLCSYEYVFFAAQYEKVRNDGCVGSLAVLKAVGVNKEGLREVMGISCSLSEAEVHWRRDLKKG